MTFDIAIERLVALAMIVTGVSHVLAPRAWVGLFERIRATGPAAGLLNAYLHFPLGALIVAFHWRWSGPGLLVTLLGAAWTVKGGLYFAWPALADRSLARVGPERAWEFQAAGAIAIVLGAAAAWFSIR